MQERRKFSRLNTLVNVVYTKYDSSQKGKLSLSKNISKGGICLIIYEEVKESDLLDLNIFLPEDNVPINAIGRVVWVKEFVIGSASSGRRFDAGIEFIKIDEQQRKRIEKYTFSIIK